ncbi:MAG: hypothetical protein RIT81_05445 [Deltaproteobacteria bacterium]
MQRRTLALVLLALVASGCSDSTGSAWYAEGHGPLRTPCQTTYYTLLLVGRTTCSPLPPTPETREPAFWSGDLPKSSVVEDLDGLTLVQATHGYGSPYVFSNATYDDDGNITEVRFPENFPGNEDGYSFHFTYEDGRHTGSYAMTPEGRAGDAVVRYEDGRRAFDGHPEVEGSRFYYRYDDEGRLIAKIGGDNLDDLPDAPQPEMLDQVCNGWTVPNAEPPIGGVFGLTGGTYYFRDADGRVETMISGHTPGAAFSKATFDWDGDRLLGYTQECSDALGLPFADHRRTYRY